MLPWRLLGTFFSLYIAPVYSALRMGTWVYTAVDISIRILCINYSVVGIFPEKSRCVRLDTCDRL